MRETLYNQRFNDIYFSPEDGLAETRHVFLDGNGLSERWQGRERFTICETGFGTGLNFLAAAALFAKTAKPGQALDYVSVELYPLDPDEIAAALEGWRADFGGLLEQMLSAYPLRVPGFHRIMLTPQIRLTLIFDDARAALPQLIAPRGVDAWFLDGFAPAKNPEMWGDALYREMARLSAPDATAATFTAAGHVRRGLDAAGFAVEKKPGFGRKKDMTFARFKGGTKSPTKQNAPKRIAIVGGGLAGTSCAYVLRQRGAQPVIFEQANSLAAGASGNVLGLYNPRFTAQRGPEADFYASAYARAFSALRRLAAKHEIAFNPCGALHLANSPEKQKRFDSFYRNGGWDQDHLRYLDAGEASAQAGIRLEHEALFLPQSGSVSPAALCAAYAQDVEIRLSTQGPPGGEGFDAVVIANGFAAKTLAGLEWLPLHTVRGQVSIAAASGKSKLLRSHLCYGGYFSAGSFHVLGATFQKWRDDTGVTTEDHRDNLARLAENVPALAAEMRITGGRAALRTASADHFPVIGPACDREMAPIDGLYLSTGHGSHGILSALAGAHLLADMIEGSPHSLPRQSVEMLDGARFIARARRKGRA